MRHLKIFSTILFISFYCSIYGQVNLATGASEFGIPIFSYGDQNKLGFSLSLDYTAGHGLLVNTVASEVGTGWELNGCSYIVRQQRGLPDDQKRNMALIVQNPLPTSTWVTSADYIQTYYPNGYIYTVFNPTDNLTNEVAYTRMNAVQFDGSWQGYIPNEASLADRLQDIFTICIGKEKIDFVIDKTLNQIRCLDNSKFKIEAVTEDMFAANVKTTIGKFIVTSPQGIKYLFDSKEFSEEIIYDKKQSVNGVFNPDPDYVPPLVWDIHSIPEGASNPKVAVVKGRPVGKFIVTKWFLSEIINPSNNKKIIFTYENYQLRRNTGRSLSYFKGLSMTIGREILNTKRLTKINFPDMTELSFAYDPLLRVDVPNKPLREIIQKRNNVVQSKTVFDYEYFFASSLLPYNYSFAQDKKFMARLSLKSVQKYGISGPAEPPHTFEYNLGTAGPTAHNNWDPQGIVYVGPKDIVPPSFSILTDHWGYYNSSNLNPRSELTYMESDVVVTTGFATEPMNAFSHKRAIDGLAKNGILKAVHYPFGGSLSFDYEQNSAYYNGQNTISGGVRVKKTTIYDGEDHLKDITKEYSYLKEDNISSSGWGLEPYTYQRNILNRIFASSQGRQPVATNALATSLLTNVITAFSNIWANHIPWNVHTKQGMNGAAGAYAIITQIIVHIIMEIFSNPPDYIDENGIQYSTESFESENPLPRLYSRVEVIEKVGATSPNGTQIFEFNSPADQPIAIPTFQIVSSLQPRFVRGFYGLVKKMKIKDVGGNIVKENINEYQVVNDNSSFVLNKSWYANRYFYDRFPVVFSGQITTVSDYITQATWGIPSNFVVLKKSRELLYKPGISGAVERVTDLTYTTDYHNIRISKTTDSRGNSLEARNYFSSDYSAVNYPVLGSMVVANMTDDVISQEMWRTKPAGAPELISLAVNEYGQVSNGNYMPVKTYGFETDAPVPESIIGNFNGNSLIRNSTYIKPRTEILYHANGWPSEVKNIEADSYSSTLYGYNDSYEIAKISNARISEVAYNSFEESASAGAWLVSGANILNEQSPTGSKCLQLVTGNSINTPIPINKNYTLSFWSTGQVNISGNITLITSNPTINGWTYYEYKIASGSTSPILSGSGKIDELRLYPENARMVTTTYEPGSGKTSVCDVNNRIQYYTYDQAGRPDKQYDEQRNIIKTYEYKYKNLP